MTTHARNILNHLVVPVLAALAVTSVAVTGTTGAQASTNPAAAKTTKPTIVLVHGAWADSSSWSKIIPRLERDGYTVLAEPNPLRSLSGDAAYLSAFIQQRTKGAVVLVGHSYGGMVITDAAQSDPTVKALVYVDAFAPAKGESALGLQSSVPGAPAASKLFDAVRYPGAPSGDADLYLKKAPFIHSFATGLPRTKKLKLYAEQRPVTLQALSAPSTTPAWKSLPSWYVLGTRDQIIAPSLQRMMAKRAHSHITRVVSGHLSLLTHPKVITQSIISAARHA